LPNDLYSEFQVTFDDGHKQSFYPLQYHLHSPSEHTINGELFDLELHIVHKDGNGNAAAVIGILFDVSNHTMAENFALN
jgi:carbonic anhydrase